MKGTGGGRAAMTVGVLLLIAGTAWWAWKQDDGSGPPARGEAARTAAPSHVEPVIPVLSPLARMGARLFTENCARCHGENATGTDHGPPLLHDIYNPGHHPDEAFYRAVRRGVPQHHWHFGNMPPLPEVKRRHVQAIVAWIRELQRANGITYRPHRM